MESDSTIITEEQLSIIKSLHCERLTSNPENHRAINSFTCKRNEYFKHFLTESAWSLDDKDEVAVFLIKDSEEDILFYFSLQNGLVYDKLYNPVEEISYNNNSSFSTSSSTVFSGSVANSLHAFSTLNTFFSFVNDVGKENEMMLRVNNIYSSIVVSHFCANDNTKKKWVGLKLPKSIGQIAFWFFLIEKVFSSHEFSGSKYLQLFAADDNSGKLLRYYSSFLGFKKDDSLLTVKPKADFDCDFMVRDMSSLLTEKERFLSLFNDRP